MGYISYSTIKLCKECPACFWWKVKHGINRTVPWSSNLPNVIENFVLNKFLEYRKAGKLPPEFNIPELKKFKLIDLENHKKWKNPMIYEPIYDEMVANPDDILTDGKNLIVIDIKTTGKYAKNCTEESMLEDIEKYNYKLQLEYYSYIFKGAGHKVGNTGYILFCFLDKGRNEDDIKLKYKLISLKIDLNNAKKLILEAKKILKSDKPPKGRCEFCSSHKERRKDFLKKQKEQEEIMDKVLETLEKKEKD